MRPPVIVSPPSLRQQVQTLERQLLQHRLRARILSAEIKQKTTARLISPVTLLAGFGTGIALEQLGRNRKWTYSNVFDVAYACAKLLLFASARQLTSGNTQNNTQPAVADEPGRY